MTYAASNWNVGRGIFKPGGYGGGIFDGNLSGLGADAPVTLAPALSERNQGLLNGALVGGIVGFVMGYLVCKVRRS